MFGALPLLLKTTPPAPPNPLTIGLLHYWKLDGTALDSVGTAHGTDTGVSYPAAIINQGAGVGSTGSNSVWTTQDGVLGNGARSLSLWYNFPSLNMANMGWNKLFEYGGVAGFMTWFAIGAQPVSGMMMPPFTSYNVSVNVGAANTAIISVTPAWHHVVVTYPGTTCDAMKVYVDGTLRTTGMMPGGMPLATNDTTKMAIGGNHLSPPVAFGTIDEVGMWSRELTEPEVTELYNSGAGSQYPF